APDTFGTIFGIGLDDWLTMHNGTPHADELLSILNVCGNLPPRSTRDPGQIATRAREKELVKRRLAVLVAGNAAVRTLGEEAVRRFNGIAGQPHSFDLLDGLLKEQ